MHASKPAFALLLLVALSAGLSACGRKGALLTPAQAAAQAETDAAAKKAEAAEKAVVDRPFILDRLIGG